MSRKTIDLTRSIANLGNLSPPKVERAVILPPRKDEPEAQLSGLIGTARRGRPRGSRNGPITPDGELNLMGRIAAMLDGLDERTRRRAWMWLKDRYEE